MTSADATKMLDRVRPVLADLRAMQDASSDALISDLKSAAGANAERLWHLCQDLMAVEKLCG